MYSSTLEHNPLQRRCSISFTPLLGSSFWDGCCLSLRSCPLVSWLPLPRESAPCLALWPTGPVEASLSLHLRGLCLLTRVASLVLLVSQHFLFCDHALAHSGHTSAVSTGTARDPCEQSSSSPRATSSRSPCITGRHRSRSLLCWSLLCWYLGACFIGQLRSSNGGV